MPLGMSFHVLIEDQGLALAATLVSFGSNWFMLCPSFRSCACPSCYSRTSAPSSFLGSLKRVWHTHLFPQ